MLKVPGMNQDVVEYVKNADGLVLIHVVREDDMDGVDTHKEIIKITPG